MVIGFFTWRNNCWYADYMKSNDIRLCVILIRFNRNVDKKDSFKFKKFGIFPYLHEVTSSEFLIFIR